MCYSSCPREDYHGECMYPGIMKDDECHCHEPEEETDEDNEEE